MGFADDVQKWGKKIGARIDQIPRIVAVQIATKVIERTPVDTGRAKGNWHASIDTPSSAVTDDTDKSGSQAIANAASEAGDFRGGHVFYLVNNLPYIRNLEHGSSKQAPAGMVAVTAAEFEAAVAKAVRDTDG